MTATLSDLLELPALAGARLRPADADPELTIDRLHGHGGQADGRCLALGAPQPGAGAVLVQGWDGPTPTVPTLALPPGADWTAAVGAVAEAVRGPGGIARAARARATLRRLATVTATAADVGEQAELLLGAPVALLDEYLDQLAAAGVSLEQRSVLVAAIDRARNAGPVSVIGALERDPPPGALVRPVGASGEPIGVVVAWIDEPSIGQLAVLDELDSAVLGMRSRDAVRAATESRLRGDFIDELSSGEAIPADAVVRRARHLGVDLSRGATALVGALQDPHDPGRRVTDRRLVHRFGQRMRSVIAMDRPRALVEWRDDALLVLLPPRAVDDNEDAAAAALARRMIGATAETLTGLELTLAVSRYTSDPATVGSAIEEARLAYDIGERLGRFGELVSFEETGTYKLLFRVLSERPDELALFHRETLASAVTYDRENGTGLVATLATYLEADANLAATATALFAHRHTIRYRLDRLAEVTGLSVTRSDDREQLSLGLKAMRLLRVEIPRPESPQDEGPSD